MNFRLAYKSGINYIDLFPKTNTDGIIDLEKTFTIETLNVNVPATTNQIQSIAVTTTSNMLNSVYQYFLVNSTTSETSIADFATISKIDITTNQITITRLNDMPTNSIDIIIVFFVKEI